MALANLGYYYLIIFCIVGHECIDISSLEDITESTCFENCENVTEVSTTEIYSQNEGFTKPSLNDKNDYEDETTENIRVYTLKPHNPLLPGFTGKRNNTETTFPVSKKPAAKVEKTKSDICECDFQVSSCDVNCCCDSDCTDSQIEVFSFCSNIHEKLYDSRYCYRKNFLFHNTSKFILEKLADNLFCIVYDNLPPVYTVNNNVSIKNEVDLDQAINKIDPYNFKWNIESTWKDATFDEVKEPYRHGDTIWKFEKTLIEPLEFLQTGFTGICSFVKPITFLEDWKGSCLQTNLSKNNSFLFPEKYNNFTVIKSPHLLDLKRFNRYRKCIASICATVESNFCSGSWTNCTKLQKSPTTCSDEKCNNVVKSVRYVIKHNGTMGIDDIQLYIQEANITSNFYQKFEVIFEWTNEDKNKSIKRSGNPGYIMGNPIFIGSLAANNSLIPGVKNIILNKANKYLTLPIAKEGGKCDDLEKYTINFGENVKLKCKLNFKSKYFSSSTCAELQNNIFSLLLTKSFLNLTGANASKLQISKSGSTFDQNVSNWVEVFFNQVLRNNAMGRLYEDKIWCGRLITSMRVDIVHSILSKPEFVDNHVILGAGITFANSSVISWPKCKTVNCVDNLEVDIVSYASFHDASKPSKIYFASGPNLDISLPYDFFYPFLSNSETKVRAGNLIVFCLLIAVFRYR